VTELRKL